MKIKTYTNVALAIVCILLGITLSLQFKSIHSNQKMDTANNNRLEDVRDELLASKQNIDALTKRNEELKDENLKYEKLSGNISGETETLKNELERVRMAAGFMAVRGKGLIITLQDTEGEVVMDADLLSVLNELRASDVQAISINGERIVALSEVRKAGRYIMINQKQMVSPFVIKAIAEPDKLEHALIIVGGVIEKLETSYNLNVKIEKSEDLLIPALKDDGLVIKTDLLKPVK